MSYIQQPSSALARVKRSASEHDEPEAKRQKCSPITRIRKTSTEMHCTTTTTTTITTDFSTETKKVEKSINKVTEETVTEVKCVCWNLICTMENVYKRRSPLSGMYDPKCPCGFC